jgi:sugar lactone lactonase YvrE
MTDDSAMPAPITWCEADLELGEGPRWVGGRLVLVDILSGRLLEADGERPGPLRTVLTLEEPLGAVAPVSGRPGTWIAAAGTGIALLSESGSLEWLDRRDSPGSALRRMNDGSCDPAGRFWAGCMTYDAVPGQGALYRADADGTVTLMMDGLTIPNGPAFSADGTTMFIADSARGIVLRIPVGATGALAEPTTIVDLAEGSPDGMTVDTDGNLWVAIWGCGEVHHYTSDGDLLRRIRVPARQPTAPCLGGPDGRRLFITTASRGLAAPDLEQSGSIFAIDVAAPGVPAYAFALGGH